MPTPGKRSAIILALVLAAGHAAAGKGDLDPYEILRNYFDASGGLDRMKGERSYYYETTISIGGLQGTGREWNIKPDRFRGEAEIGPIRIVQGDNGEMTWSLDTNGKLQKTTKFDEPTVKRREIDRRMAEYEYADPASEIFTVAYRGTETVEGAVCHMIHVANSVNADNTTLFIEADSFRLARRISIRAEESTDNFFGDYRDVDGLLVAHYRKEIPYQTHQPQEMRLTEYESNPEIDSALFEPPEEGAKDYRFVEGNAAEDIPVRYVGGHIFIPVVTAGRERLWILDSGANMSVLHKPFADEIGIEQSGEIAGSGAGGTVDVTFATLPSFEVRGILFDEQTMAVIDMSELMNLLELEVAGILGFDFLSRFVTKVDYAGGTVSFYEPESFTYEGNGRALDTHIADGHIEVEATLDGKHSGTWLVDLGAGSTHLHSCFAKIHGYVDEKGVLGMGHGAGNAYEAKAVRCGSIDFAGYTVHEPRVAFSLGCRDAVFTDDRIGTLGNTLFRNFTIYLDYGRERLIVEKGSKFEGDWPRDRSGLRLGWGGERDRIVVFYVSPETPADEAGFRRGDILKSINGIGVGRLRGLEAVNLLLSEDAGTEYDVVVLREGTTKKLEITLEDLY